MARSIPSPSPTSAARPATPWCCRCAAPEEPGDTFRFTQGQYLTFRALDRRRGGAPLLFDLRRRATSRAARRHQEGRGRRCSRTGPTRRLQAGQHARSDAADGQLLRAARPGEPQALRRLRRRQRHHAAAQHHQDGAGGRAARSFTLVYGNRSLQLDHVPRGARGPEEQHLERVEPDPHPRAASSRTWISSTAASTRRSARQLFAHWLDVGRSTPPSSAGRRTMMLQVSDSAAGARARQAPDQVRAVRHRRRRAAQARRRAPRRRPAPTCARRR